MSNADPFPDDDDSDDGSQAGDSSVIQKLRARETELSKEVKRLAKEHAELAKFKAEVETRTRAEAVKAAVTGAGLKPEHADLFLAVNGNEAEANEETIKAFAEKYSLTAAPPSDNNTVTGNTTTNVPTAGFSIRGNQFYSPTAPGTPSTGQAMSKQEWNELYRRDPGRAMQVRDRVAFANVDNPLAPG